MLRALSTQWTYTRTQRGCTCTLAGSAPGTLVLFKLSVLNTYSSTDPQYWLHAWRQYHWSSDFALYLEDCLMDEWPTSDYQSVWHKNWPHKIYVGQWPIFHGRVIVLIILIRYMMALAGGIPALQALALVDLVNPLLIQNMKLHSIFLLITSMVC